MKTPSPKKPRVKPAANKKGNKKPAAPAPNRLSYVTKPPRTRSAALAIIRRLQRKPHLKQWIGDMVGRASDSTTGRVGADLLSKLSDAQTIWLACFLVEFYEAPAAYVTEGRRASRRAQQADVFSQHSSNRSHRSEQVNEAYNEEN